MARSANAETASRRRRARSLSGVGVERICRAEASSIDTPVVRLIGFGGLNGNERSIGVSSCGQPKWDEELNAREGLLVEDDELIPFTTAEMLSDIGCRVKERDPRCEALQSRRVA